MASMIRAPRANGLRAARVGTAQAVTTVRRAPLAQRFARKQVCKPVAAIEIDWTDPDTLTGLAGVALGLVVGIGAPLWYIQRTERDEERLEELREMNRATFKETGEYMSEDEIASIRKPKWTDRREWVDDD